MFERTSPYKEPEHANDSSQESASHEDVSHEHGTCIDCGTELKPYEDEVCLECEDKRYREHGIDTFLE